MAVADRAPQGFTLGDAMGGVFTKLAALEAREQGGVALEEDGNGDQDVTGAIGVPSVEPAGETSMVKSKQQTMSEAFPRPLLCYAKDLHGDDEQQAMSKAVPRPLLCYPKAPKVALWQLIWKSSEKSTFPNASKKVQKSQPFQK